MAIGPAALPARPRARVLGAKGSVTGARSPAPLALAVYGGFAAVALGVAAARGASPIETDPWLDALLPLGAGLAHALSLTGGLVLAAATVALTRVVVRKSAWARLLHGDLRSVVRGASDPTLVVLGLASGVAEELFFRGILAPALGLVLSSLLFGVIHRLRGRIGWIWATWAGVMGLLFGALFLATGSLVGPLVAHAAINVVNLRFLRDTDLEPRKPRRLGGLLGQA